jgi:ubiquitin carboxyl-terminal hydrolase 7
MDKLEEKMKGTPVEGTVKALFEGSTRNYIKCVNVDYASLREETFYDIQLDVKGCRTIHDR